MQILREFIIVKVPSVFINEVAFQKEVKGSITKLFVETAFNPERHIRCWGTVVSVPSILLDYPILTASEELGIPSWNDSPGFACKKVSDIEMEIEVGTKVYFHRNAILPDQGYGRFNNFHMFSKKEMENGKEVEYHYFRIKYELCYATVAYVPINRITPAFEWWMEPELAEIPLSHAPETDEDEIPDRKILEKMYMRPNGDTYYKKITMIGSYCLITPDHETWDDIAIPTPMVINGKKLIGEDGKPIMKPKSEWIVTKSRPGEKYLCGWINYIGSPLKGDTKELAAGMYISFRPNANAVLKFEGKDYFRMLQRNIVGYWPGKEKVTLNQNVYAKVD